MSETVPSLCQAYNPYFPIGAAVSPRSLEVQRDLLVHHYNSLTAENCMKPESVQRVEGIFTFGDADTLADFAREHRMKLRGHTLVWHSQTPDWFFEAGEGNDGGVAEPEALLARMEAHIGAVVGRYRGAVYAWDVVNEAVSDSGPELLRTNSRWGAILGDDYLLHAFQFAHATDPAALLFYNDYNECETGKRDRIVAMLKGLLARGAPIHGFGMQGHWGLSSPPLDSIRASIEAYAALGLMVQVTELDISMYEWSHGPSDLTEPTAEMLDAQTKRYGEIFAIFREYRDVITGVTFWGASDDHTWLDNFPEKGRKNWPFVFDTEHRPKKSFRTILP